MGGDHLVRFQANILSVSYYFQLVTKDESYSFSWCLIVMIAGRKNGVINMSKNCLLGVELTIK